MAPTPYTPIVYGINVVNAAATDIISVYTIMAARGAALRVA